MISFWPKWKILSQEIGIKEKLLYVYMNEKTRWWLKYYVIQTIRVVNKKNKHTDNKILGYSKWLLEERWKI